MAITLSKVKNLNLKVIVPSSKDSLLNEKWDDLSIIRFQYWFPQRNQALAYGKEDTYSNIKRSVWILCQIPVYLFMFFLKIISVWSKSDIFHCQWTFTAVFPIIINKILPFIRKPVIISCRGSDLRLLPGWLNRFFLRNTDAVTYGSPLKTINRYRDKVGVDIIKYINENTSIGAFCIFDPLDEKNLLKITHDLKTTMGYENKKIILFLGRLDNFKDPLYALNIMRELKNKRVDTVLLIVGHGVLEEQVKQFINDNELKKFVNFLGPKSDVANYYNMADIFLALSPVENVWSSTIAEAMMVGCPVMLTDVGNTSQVFTHDFDSIIASLGNPEEFAKKINNLLDDQEKLESLALNAKSTLKKYRRYEKQSIEDYVKLYTDIHKLNI